MSLQSLKNVYHGLSSLCAAMYYGFPARNIQVIGVTGTDGKTTTTHLIHHILKSSGKKASMVSSVYAEIAGKIYDTGFHVTTPDSWMLQKFLRAAVDSGEEYMVLEVTSHALDQQRVLGIPFEIAVLTNITHEHLDYHKTYESYLKTKEKLLENAKIRIVNRDDESYKHLSILKNKRSEHSITDPVARSIALVFPHVTDDIITYAVEQKADLTPKNFKFKINLPGIHNQYNALAAAAVGKILKISDKNIAKSLIDFAGVKGRYERVANSEGLSIIIDFAHTPNALKNVLPTAKKETKGHLIHLFGCAALRDVAKRPIMGAISAEFADYIILTEEDYRTEDVHEIIEQIAHGCMKAGAKEFLPQDVTAAQKMKVPVFFRIPNRTEAVNFAISKLAQKGDLVLLTGKAHETSLCRGTTEYPWSEHAAVMSALALRKQRR